MSPSSIRQVSARAVATSLSSNLINVPEVVPVLAHGSTLVAVDDAIVAMVAALVRHELSPEAAGIAAAVHDAGRQLEQAARAAQLVPLTGVDAFDTPHRISLNSLKSTRLSELSPSR